LGQSKIKFLCLIKRNFVAGILKKKRELPMVVTLEDYDQPVSEFEAKGK
jgi:hypothetical protein